MKAELIFKRLKDDYDYCVSKGYEVVGVFLFGSQNYHVDTETSDIDVKAMVIPSLNNIVFGRTSVSERVKRDNGELVIYDIDSIHKSIVKQSINFVEILFTDYKIMNPEYVHLYAPMFEHREKIANLNLFKTLHCTLSMAGNKHKMLFHESPANEARIKLKGYDYKAFAEILRLYDFLATRYYGEKTYEASLTSKNAEKLILIKQGNSDFSTDVVKELADKVIHRMKTLVDRYSNKMGEVIDEESIVFIEEVTRNIILKYIKTEVDRYDGADSTDWPAWCR